MAEDEDGVEDAVGGLIAAGSLPPSFDDPLVVPEDRDVLTLA
jgi:hypothetical protein